MNKLLVAVYRRFQQLDRIIDRSCSFLIVGTVISLLLFSVIGIVARWLNMPFVWVEPLTRHLVFLVAFLGGVITTGRKGHIAIDILSRYLQAFDNAKVQLRFNRFVYAVSAVVSWWLASTSYHFFKVEMQYGKEVLFGLTSGHLVVIIPLGFLLIGYRFFMLFLSSITIFHQPGAKS